MWLVGNPFYVVMVLSVSGQKAKKELTDQQKEKLKNKRVLESCLTLVRSLYSREEVSNFSPLTRPRGRKPSRTSSWSTPPR